MGDFQGHPFRGNQYTAGGVTARFNPNLTSEARNVGEGKYEVGPKFLKLPPEVQVHVLKHEEGHDLSDEMLRDMGPTGAWAALDAGILPTEEGLNGQTTPGEIIAEAYALAHTDPQFLREKHPKLANLMESKIREWRRGKTR